MKEEVSAGVILFRERRGKREYLLLKSRTGDWEFPKGGIENGEELQQTALREVEEEAGIGHVNLVDGFRQEYDYIFQAGPDTIHKTVHLFIGEAHETNATLSKEHHDHQWRDIEQAIGTLSHDGPTEILRDAQELLNEQSEVSE